jgi:EpsI family protein
MSDTDQLSPVWWPRFWRSPAMLVLCGLLIVSFWWTIHWMVIRWDEVNSYYSHGWLIPPLVVVLIYLKRKPLAAARVRPSRWGLAVLGPALLLHVLGTAWQVGFMSGFALIGVLIGLVLALFGAQVLRIVLFPLLFLAFMVPLPVLLVESVTFRLKLLAARLAVGVLTAAGLPAVRTGSMIHIPTGTLVVDDVCSGLKYVISLTAFGAFYALVCSMNKAQKLALFLLSVPISLLANVIRIILMVVVGSFLGVAIAEKWYFHGMLGFLLFGLAFGMLFAAEALFRRYGSPEGKGQERRTFHVAPDGSKGGRPAPRPGRLYGVALAALLLTAGFSTFLAWPRSTVAATDVLARIPLTLGPWTGTDYPLDQRTYDILGTHDVLSRFYTDRRPRTDRAGQRVELVVVIARQTRKRTHPPEQCMRGNGYTIVHDADRQVTLPLASGTTLLTVRELILRRQDEQRVVWYFYKSGKDLTTSYWRHQVGLALSRLVKPDAADVLIRVDTEAPAGDLDSARQTLRSFLSAALPDLLTRLP